MSISYLLAPEPRWILINNEGTVAGGGKLYTYNSLNKVLPQAVYQDEGGTIPWTNPIVFDLNGVQGPFYWEVDTANPDNTYYLEAYDADGNLLWTQDNFIPPGGGGGSDVTTYIPINNFIANNVFIDHVSDTVNPVGVTNMVIAPSNHKGFTPSLINPISSTYGVVSPDIIFNKNNTLATDQIMFPLFALGTLPLTGDVTPTNYLRYQCTNTPSGETFKNFQFPICQKVQNLSNQDMTFTLWAAVTATPVTINIYIRQYFGSGTAASPDTRTLIGSCVLSTTWTAFNIPFPVPSVSGKSIGTPGMQTDDDAVYIQIEMPLDSPCDVLFTKPCLFLGTINPDLEFDDYDQINSVNSTPRTGDVKTSFLSSAPQGWVPMNDGTIGTVGSGATTRANQDVFQLYKTLWDGVSNTYAPVAGGRGASAVADFVGGKVMTLPLSLGRALSGSGAGSGLTARTLGQSLGTEAILYAGMPLHNHTGSTGTINVGGGSGGGSLPRGVDSSPSTTNAVSLSIANAGGGTLNTKGAPDGNMPPTLYLNVYIKL